MTTRRLFMMQAVASVAAASLGARAWAEDRTPLGEDDAEARKFEYVADATKVDIKKHPEFKPGDKCAKCQIYDDGPNNMGGCPIFAGKLVAANGWCNAFS
jgi:hypothetical protein